MSRRRVLIALLTMTAGAVTAGASPLFDEQTVLEVTITGPFGTLIADKEGREERPFLLTAEGVDHRIDIRVRGNSRLRVCRFPPLRLDFPRVGTGETPFAGQDKLKLVTHCRRSAEAGLNVLDEIAAYRIFNRISATSYRTRLLRIDYVDTDAAANDDPLQRYGFVIETSEELAGRIGGRPVELEGVRLSTLDQEHAASVYVFQYLIGNTDWSLVTADGDEFCCHNGELFEVDSLLYYVPYDFDLAGLVDARYARPDPSLHIKSVTQRRYRGYCTSPDALGSALETIRHRRAGILGVVDELPGVAEKDREKRIRYLDRFFTEAREPRKMLESFQRRCL